MWQVSAHASRSPSKSSYQVGRLNSSIALTLGLQESMRAASVEASCPRPPLYSSVSGSPARLVTRRPPLPPKFRPAVPERKSSLDRCGGEVGPRLGRPAHCPALPEPQANNQPRLPTFLSCGEVEGGTGGGSGSGEANNNSGGRGGLEDRTPTNDNQPSLSLQVSRLEDAAGNLFNFLQVWWIFYMDYGRLKP